MLGDLFNVQPGSIIRYSGNVFDQCWAAPNSLAQHQQANMLNSLLGQQQLAAFAANQTADPETQRYRDAAHNEWARGRAKEYTDKGERIVDRIAFWGAWAPFSWPILYRLSVKLDKTTAEAERYLAMIRPEKEPTEPERS
jgi:hypothetical protein